MEQVKGTSLRSWRFYKQMPQKELEVRTGINQTKISHIERGFVMPTPDEKKRIARALNVPVNDVNFFLVTDEQPEG